MDSSALLAIFGSCVQSMVQLTLITASGAFLTYRKIFTEETNASIAAACANFFFPMFILANLGQSLSLSKFLSELALFFSPFVTIFLSSIVGLIQQAIVPPPKKLRFSLLGLMCFNNSGNVPMLILAGACKDYGPLGGDSHCKDALGYVALGVFNFNLLCWTYGAFLFQLDQKQSSSALLDSSAGSPPSNLRTFLSNLTSPVPLGSYLGLLSGLLPGTQWLFFEKEAPLRPLTDTLELIGLVGIVISQMILGSNLVLMHGRPTSLSKGFIVACLGTRLVVLPMLALGVTKLYSLAGIATGDRVQLYVLFLGFASPTAVSVLVLSQLMNVGVNELTKLIFLQYIFAVATLTLSSYAFFLIF